MKQDLISRWNTINKISRVMGEHTYYNKKQVIDIVRSIPSTQPVQKSKWILTKDRKPEPLTDVLVTYVSKYGIKYVVTASFDLEKDLEKFYIHILRADFDKSRVPAWMPLPEPYEGEQNE